MESLPIDDGKQQQQNQQENSLQSESQVKNELNVNNNNFIQQEHQNAQIPINNQEDANTNSNFNQINTNTSTNPNEYPVLNAQTKERNKKRKFTQEEDEKLRELVQNHGQKQWDVIARNIATDRTARQCRDRWKHYLSPSVSQKEWTITEDRLLLNCTQKYGAQWAALVKFFPGRTDINLKNRWNKLQRKSRKLFQTNPNVQIPKLPANPEHIHFLNPNNMILNQNQNQNLNTNINQNDDLASTLPNQIPVSANSMAPAAHIANDNNSKEEIPNSVLNNTNDNMNNLNNNYSNTNDTNVNENNIPIISPVSITDSNVNNSIQNPPPS